MNKFDRVISTLVMLQTKKTVKANAISERFDTSLRTVYRDITSLRNAGIPIIGNPGIGYSIMDGYRLPQVMFNEGESAALLTAEKFIGKLTDQKTQRYYSSALMKIKAILRNTEKQSLEILDNSIAISNYKNLNNKDYLQDLFKSIAAKKILTIQYQKVDGTSSDRMLEPIGCYHQFNNWYLIAFCQQKKDYRTFKLDRIVNLEILNQRFNNEHITLQRYIEGQNEDKKEKQQFHSIEIAFNQSFVKFADSRKYYFGFIEQKVKDDIVCMKFLYNSIEVMARWLLQFGDQATVLESPALKARLKTLANQLHKHYR